MCRPGAYAALQGILQLWWRTVEAPEVTPMVSGPSRSQGAVSTSSPCASLCVMALRATSMQAAEFTQNDGTPFTSGISCAPPRRVRPSASSTKPLSPRLLHALRFTYRLCLVDQRALCLYAGNVLTRSMHAVLHAGGLPTRTTRIAAQDQALLRQDHLEL